MEMPDPYESKEEQELLAVLPSRTRSGIYSRLAVSAASLLLGFFCVACLALLNLPVLGGPIESSRMLIAESLLQSSYSTILSGAILAAIIARYSGERKGWLVFFSFSAPAFLLALFAILQLAAGALII